MADENRIRPADLVAEGGTAGNAADLIDAVYTSTPPALQKALLMRHHSRIHAEDSVDTPELDLAKVAKVAGLDEVKAASIRGGSLGSAWVVYVAEDHLGANYKGAFPFSDLDGRGQSKEHVSEAEAFEQSPVGQRLRESREKQAEAEESEGVTSTRRARPPQPSESDDS